MKTLPFIEDVHNYGAFITPKNEIIISRGGASGHAVIANELLFEREVTVLVPTGGGTLQRKI